MNDSQLINSLQTKVAALEAEVRRLTNALALEKGRSEEWKKQAVRLAEEAERNHALDHPEKRKRDSVEGAPEERDP